MQAYEDMKYFDKSEELVKVLCQKTQNPNPHFFRVLVGYYLSKVASMMRISVATHDRGKVPINMYAINLMLSGQGKGHSTNIMEEQVIHLFRERFLDETLHFKAEENLLHLANKRAVKSGGDPDDEIKKVRTEYAALGELAFSFDSGTPAAVKQMRHKLLMANAGSMNAEIDEIGSNLLSNADMLTTYLELFDMGKVKQKLTKNTAENTRNAEIEGRTPANLLMFGTPDKLLNGSKVEDEFLSFIDTGYGRRCFFGYQPVNPVQEVLTAKEVYAALTDNSSVSVLDDMADHLYDLADMGYFGMDLTVSEDMSILLIEYKQDCELRASAMAAHQGMLKAELVHRYFKVLKLAGAYAFIDASYSVNQVHIEAAIKVAEDSGSNFADMFTRDRNYVKLAKYIAANDKEMTHVDLMEDLPFYKGAESMRRELLTLATAWGYKNNVIIKKMVAEGIEFLKGETLREVDLDCVRVAYSNHFAENYSNEEVKFSELHNLTQESGYHWVNHHLIDGYRKEENAMVGCDMLVLDIDTGVSMDTAKMLLKDYTYHIHTSKSHNIVSDKNPKGENRFRIVMPLSHHMKLDAADFKQFMENVYEWLPFDVDDCTGQRARKWETFKGEYFYNAGEPIDALSFIPQTSKADAYKAANADLKNLDSVERWFIGQTGSGNRSNNLIRYALMLVDDGQDVATIQNAVLLLNGKLAEPLAEAEIYSTIMQTVTVGISKRANP